MKRKDLQREGKQWVKEGIITAEQLTQILNRKEETHPNYIIILFAALLTVLGFFTFMMSDWAQQPGLSRVLLFIAFMMVFYLVGANWYKKRQDIFGISFIVIGYALFGAGLLQILSIYNVIIYSAWPIIVWGLVGIVLLYLYPHKVLFAGVTAVFVFGHIYHSGSLAYFSWILFVLFLISIGIYTFKKEDKLFSYLFSIGFVIQMILLVVNIDEPYYWFIILILLFFTVADLLKKDVQRLAIKYISLLSMFIFSIFQTFTLNSEWYMEDIELQWSFLIVWLVLIISSIVIKKAQNRTEGYINYILFLPIVFIPFSHIISFVLLFVFSLSFILNGLSNSDQRNITIGTTAFLITTFVTYIQFAWDSMNRSLFFFIGGLLLFAIGFIMDKQIKQLRTQQEEEER